MCKIYDHTCNFFNLFKISHLTLMSRISMEVFGEYQKEIEVMYDIIHELVHKSLEIYHSLRQEQVKIKRDGSVVSICDFAFQMLIMHHVHKFFKDDKFLGEEEFNGISDEFLQKVAELIPKDIDINVLLEEQKHTIRHITNDMNRVWVVDPIDGTAGFTTNGQYAIATALLVNRETVLSVTAWPGHNQKYTNLPFGGPAIFCCAKGRGAFAIDMEKNIYPVHLPYKDPSQIDQGFPVDPVNIDHSKIKNALLFSDATGNMSPRYIRFMELMGIVDKIPIISMAKAFVLATGNAVLFPKSHKGEKIFVWDVAPVELFVREAGCYVTTADGKPVRCSEFGTIEGSEIGLIFSAYDEEKHKKACELFINSASDTKRSNV
ncbi:Inositol monophosphatase family protein [Tritrichomonas foetus]|uniref:Inositol monophosphatase family protein n=1 Tax=Tritrichomonas foetus TaxID=1144522 RepID=A0A1J4JN41_9EUKA|nr:Inositol monophosphatase family protein [Tritrichomonas foetus]|eukprot:OHS98676.1 Inositol monophosphatase family protein [Tritrichomonas foetus]